MTDSRGSDLSDTSTTSLPRERLDVLDDQSQEHLAPDVYWVTSQHVTMDITELSDGSSTFTCICHQYGLITGE